MRSPYWLAAIPAVVALTGFLFELHFLVLLAALAIVGYPVHGAVMYGDPWTWIFKKEPTDDR